MGHPWFGSKATSGLWQALVALMPSHSVYIETHLGGGAMITCNYDSTDKHRTVIGNDVFVGSDSQLIAPVRIVVDMTIGE